MFHKISRVIYVITQLYLNLGAIRWVQASQLGLEQH